MVEQVSKQKWEELLVKMEAVGILEEDLEEEFIKGGGPGGQKINKTNSCVRITHLPSGMFVRCQKSRSRESNRFFARRMLLDKMDQKIHGEASEEEKRRRKIRAQKQKRSKRAKEKMLQKKRETAEKKLRRKPVDKD